MLACCIRIEVFDSNKVHMAKRTFTNFKSIFRSTILKARKLIYEVVLFNIIYILYAKISMPSKNEEKIIGFASHHLNGELKYIFDKLEERKDITLFFATELQEEQKRLEDNFVAVYYCRDIHKIPLFVRTNVWVTSHGSYCIPDYYLNKLLKRHRGKWVDTWHGVGVEQGSGYGRASMLSSYDMAFVPSEFYVNYYNSKQDGLAKKLKITGSPRTDILVNGSLTRQDILEGLDLPQKNINVLYAPSWGNPAVGEKKDKFLFPYNKDEEIIDRLSDFCQHNGCNFIIRSHPDWENENSLYAKRIVEKIERTKGLFYRSLKDYPITEPILYATDVLITDYSSIANDFIVLNRPIIYLDKGLPEDRFIFKLSERGGFVVKSDHEMMDRLKKVLSDPMKSMDEIKGEREKYIRTIYKYLDGKASERCANEIMRLLL